MRAIIQRVSEASVSINGKIKSSISNGLLILLGVDVKDSEEDADWLSQKIALMRIFSDEKGLMNLSVSDCKGEILVVSQFTLSALTKKGNRPSFINAARPEKAVPLYELFVSKLKEQKIEVKTGEFGADMKVALVNDGPVTIIMDTHLKDQF